MIQEIHNPFSVDRKLPIRRPGQNFFRFLGVAGGTIERSCYSTLPPLVKIERDYEGETGGHHNVGNSAIRAAKQQACASSVTVKAIGSGSAALAACESGCPGDSASPKAACEA